MGIPMGELRTRFANEEGGIRPLGLGVIQLEARKRKVWKPELDFL